MRKTYMYLGGKITRKQAKRQGLVIAKAEQQGGVMVLFMVKLGYGTMNPLQKVSKGRHIVTSMTGNPYFATPTPSLADTTIALDALAVAQQAMDGSKPKTIIRNQREKEVDTIMKSLQNYVEFIANGNVDIIVSSGFDVRDPRNPIGILPIPADFSAVNTPVEGQVKLKWKAVKKKTNYLIEYTLTPGEEANVTTLESLKASMIINDMTSGAKFYFRIATIGAAGSSGYSPWIYCRPN